MQVDAEPRGAASRAPTSQDVARHAGVSQPTVSRALRDDARVAAATRARVLASAATLGYVPSRRGRSLSTRETGQVAVVVSDLGNAFYMEALAHLHAALDAADLRAVVLTEPPDRPPEPERLLDGSIDGAILTTTLLGSPLPAGLRDRGLPVVLFNRAIDDPGIDVCTSRNVEGGGAVADALVGLGHVRIGAIFGPANTSTGRDRERGFRAALDRAGVALPDRHVRHGPFAAETGDGALRELLALPEPPTAVFCGNDVVALGALNAAHALGVAIPGALTVVGFDDIAMAAWDVFDLSTVRQDVGAMARIAVDLLRARIADAGAPARRVTVPARLTLRGSHGPPPG